MSLFWFSCNAANKINISNSPQLVQVQFERRRGRGVNVQMSGGSLSHNKQSVYLLLLELIQS